jgi:O-antigen/teichoic acid export membrane protein
VRRPGTRLVARNLASNYLAYGASILSGLILTPIIIGAIGQEAYGAWAFIISLTTILRILDLGITPTVVRFTAFHQGRSATAEVSALASASFVLYLLIGLVSIVAGVVLAWLLPSMLTLNPELTRPAQVATVIAVLTLGTQAPLGLFGSLMKGAQRFDVPNTGALVSIIAYALLVIAVLTRHATLPVLATIALVATFVRLAYPLFFVRRELPGLRLSRQGVTRSEVRGLLSFSWFAFLGHAAGKVVYSADVILIGTILGPRPVALYAVAARLFGLAAGVASTGTELLLPLQSELEGRDEHERQRELVVSGIRASMCVAVLLGFPLVILPSWILTAWLGSGFETSVVPLALLGLAVFFTQPSAVLSQYLFARGKPRQLAAAQAALAIANLTLTTMLLVAEGAIWVAAMTTLVVEGIGAMIVLPVLVRRRGISFGRLFSGWAPPLGAGIVAALPTLVLARAVTDTDSLAALAVVGVAWSLVYAAVAWRIGLTASERWLVRSLATTRRRPPEEPELPEITELND